MKGVAPRANALRPLDEACFPSRGIGATRQYHHKGGRKSVQYWYCSENMEADEAGSSSEQKLPERAFLRGIKSNEFVYPLFNDI
jgi:hypothetical protein